MVLVVSLVAACHQGSPDDCHNQAVVVHHLEVPAGALISVATAVRMAVNWAGQADNCMPGHRILRLDSGYHSRHRSPVRIPLHLAHRHRDPLLAMPVPRYTASKAAAAGLVAKGADTPWLRLARGGSKLLSRQEGCDRAGHSGRMQGGRRVVGL